MQSSPTSQAEAVEPKTAQLDSELKTKRSIIWTVIAFVILFAITIIGIIFLATSEPSVVTRIRDIFIIFMAIQSLLTGLVLIILIIQLAKLINLLQNEIKPILDSTNETVNNLRGTATFLSENLVEPVIKLNEIIAGFTQLLSVLGLFKKNPKAKKE